MIGDYSGDDLQSDDEVADDLAESWTGAGAPAPQCANCGKPLGHINEACPDCLPGFYSADLAAGVARYYSDKADAQKAARARLYAAKAAYFAPGGGTEANRAELRAARRDFDASDMGD